jgi:hypothetical protein
VRSLWLIAGLLCAATSAGTAQQIDPDWCLTCRDSREHFAAGAGIDVAARIVLPRTRVWQRVLVVTAIGAAYEAGQADAPGPRGRGYGFGPKDLLLDVAGALVTEGLIALGRRIF